MNLERPEKEPVRDEAEFELLKASIDVVAEKWTPAERERLKMNLKYPGIERRYREVKQRFDEGNANRYYLGLLEDLMHDLSDFPFESSAS